MYRFSRLLAAFGTGMALISCAPLLATPDSDAGLRTIVTPQGELRLAVRDIGRGRPILLLHGLGTSSFTWHAIMPALAKNHRVIAIDLKGFGGSDKPEDGRYSIADQAEAVQAFIEQEKLSDVTVIGHSYGGGVALALALGLRNNSPSRLRNLVLIDTLAYRQPLPIFFQLLKVPLVAEIGMTVIPPEVQAAQALRLAYYDRDKITARTVAEYSSPLYSQAAKRALAATVEQIVPRDIDEAGEKYRSLKLPASIIWCEPDRIVPIRYGRRLHGDLVSSELSVLSDCGHLPHEEKPEETLGIVQAFLARHGG